jgi:hypothetical protein
MSDDEYEFIPIKSKKRAKKVKIGATSFVISELTPNPKPRIKRNRNLENKVRRSKSKIAIRLATYASLIAIGALGSTLFNQITKSTGTSIFDTAAKDTPVSTPTPSHSSIINRGSYSVVSTSPMKPKTKKHKKKLKKVSPTTMPLPVPTTNAAFTKRQRG